MMLENSNSVLTDRGDSIVVSWKLLNQSYENNTSNVYFEVKFVANQSTTSTFDNELDIYRRNSSGSYELIYGEYGSISNTTVKAGEEKILFTWVENVEHNNRTSSQRIKLSFKLINHRDIEGYKGVSVSVEGDLPPVTSGIELFDAPDFDDESNLPITYTYNIDNNYTNVQFGISLSANTENPIIAYRDAALNDNTFTFEFTEEERDLLREATPGEYRDLFVVSRGVYPDGTENKTAYLNGQVRFYIKRTAPVIHSVEIEDINPVTVALTGDKTKFINKYSTVKYSIAATGSKKAHISKYEVYYFDDDYSDNSYGMSWAELDGASGTLKYSCGTWGGYLNKMPFRVWDSRNFDIEYFAPAPTVFYKELTCTHGVTIQMSDNDTTKGVVGLTITGNWWSGNFGAADNTLKIEVRHTQNDGTMGDWVNLTDGLVPIITDTTDANYKRYTLSVKISGFEHNGVYTFQCRATDELNTVYTDEKTVRITPVFDWGENDFRFNVNVNINGAVQLNGSPLADYVIESSDDNIYSYRKWASGKLEAWRIATTTVEAIASTLYGSMYYTDDLIVETTGNASQFIAIDNVQMTVNRNGAYGMWMPVIKRCTVDSGVASVTYSLLNPTNITANIIPCVYIMGRWK